MSVSTLPAFLGIAAATVLISAGILVVALKKRHSRTLWFALSALTAGAIGGYAFYARLERIHRELFGWQVKVTNTRELVARLGSPSRRETHLDRGREIDVWFYDITLLQPPVHTQFHFHKEEWIGTFASNQ